MLSFLADKKRGGPASSPLSRPCLEGGLGCQFSKPRRAFGQGVPPTLPRNKPPGKALAAEGAVVGGPDRWAPAKGPPRSTDSTPLVWEQAGGWCVNVCWDQPPPQHPTNGWGNLLRRGSLRSVCRWGGVPSFDADQHLFILFFPSSASPKI